jgi:DNA invertase Pin-like site-specific DNA recombinase
MRKAIGLLRVSTEEQARFGRAGVDRQRFDIEEIARRENLEIATTVELIGASGPLVLEDDRFLKLLDALKQPEIAGVVVSAIDRIARPESHGALAVFDPFYRYSKLIFTAGKTIDVRKDEDFLLTGILGLVAGI